MNEAERIISKFPSQNAMAKAMSVTASAITNWKNRGVIPARQFQKVLNAAAALNVNLKATDLLEEAEPPKKRKRVKQ